MAGKLYGLSVGTGDAKLMTLRAKEILDAVKVIAVPVKALDEESTALVSIRSLIDMSEKEIMPVVFAMEHSLVKREMCRQEAAGRIQEKLDRNMDVAMIVSGDFSLYNTYHLVYAYIRDAGYDTEVIPGITNFSLGAAKAGISLVQSSQSMMVLPSLKNPKMFQETLEQCDTLVIMNAGSAMNYIGELLKEQGLEKQTLVFENEYAGPPVEGMKYGYMTTLVVKKNGL